MIFFRDIFTGKQIHFSCLLLVWSISLSSVSAQVQLSPSLISCNGGSGSTGTIILSYSVGECVINTAGPFSDIYLTQGFQQPSFKSAVTDTTINVPEGEFILHIYSGITPNNDGHNDTWQIDNIDSFPENHVLIFNRWGEKVWKGSNYDNKNIVWDGNNEQNLPLPNGTYFYIVKAEDKVYKGWVELTR